jgi:hypothetical protein
VCRQVEVPDVIVEIVVSIATVHEDHFISEEEDHVHTRARVGCTLFLNNFCPQAGGEGVVPHVIEEIQVLWIGNEATRADIGTTRERDFKGSRRQGEREGEKLLGSSVRVSGEVRVVGAIATKDPEVTSLEIQCRAMAGTL